ncbi:YigZ family protein [Klugiella xanthotipulae]|uniref:YigZ family protein n=1 Tax=Klugiella xanthotipulae TaxID=244735 RepID=UPI00114FBE89|nr:YigZ family protein [Klugiella xanthotipulae]
MNSDPGEAAPYRTIHSAVETEIEIKRSRFICFLTPVAEEDAARALIARARQLHPKARHHCSAFVLGARHEVQRTNDDGEPSGTAGAPMLEALLGAELSDVVAVVVRYFGGILLGAGGLTRAYRASVAESIGVARTVVRERRMSVVVSSDYPAAALLEAEAYRRGWVVVGTEYGGDVSMTLSIPPDQWGVLVERAAELTAGQAQPVVLGTHYVTLP